MDTSCKVALYGNSLFIAAIEASLRDRPGLQVIQIDANRNHVGETVSEAGPDAVIFDLAAAPPDFAIRFLRDHPGLPLIGLDLSSSQVLVLSGVQCDAQSTGDLAQVIYAQSTNSHAASRVPSS